MNISKIVVSGFVAVTLFGATVASAQTYYPSYNYGTTYSGSCVSLSSDLSYGQKGSAVTQLQNFLVSQNYPGGGSWMVTGNFGAATMTAVRDFQQAQGLAITGAVDASTRAAISRVSCGGFSLATSGTSYNYNQGYPYTLGAGNYNTYSNNTYTNGYPYSYTNPYLYNNYNNYNSYGTCGSYPYYTQCTSTYGTTPHLTSLSVTSAPAGTPITVYGTGFDPVNNTVYVGGTTLSNVPSNNGTSVVFTVPASSSGAINGAVSVSVGNSRGTSNALTFTVSGTGINCGVYPYTTNCTYPYQPTPCGSQYAYGYNCPPSTGVPLISYLSPATGGVGTYVTVYGSGFSTTGNTVHFGNGIISNLSSYDGYSVSFTVPSTVSGYGYQPIGLGTYNVSVSNSAGITSNTMPFSITSLGTTGTVSIGNVTGPTSLGVGVTGTWSVIIQNPTSSAVTTSVSWGDTGNGYVNQAAPQITYAQGATTITFSHSYYANGTYTITFNVGNSSGQSSTASATVYVSGSGNTGSISLSTLSPITGPIGTQVMIQGTGFDAYNNTVHFGNGGTMHVPSQNGVIYYTIPSYLSPCDVTTVGMVCAQYLQQVTPGSYPIYVTSPAGSSNTLTFQVQ